MTLEQTTELILAAAAALDPAALEEAGRERQAAIARLGLLKPTLALRDAVACSLAAGEAAKRALRAIKQHTRNESRRLANIEHGFVRALHPAARHRIDCKG
ncbi:MAG: hypothetical protein ABSF22_16010 [Bryobacteraceae bacterium]|jgi:hypothetical protein